MGESVWTYRCQGEPPPQWSDWWLWRAGIRRRSLRPEDHCRYASGRRGTTSLHPSPRPCLYWWLRLSPGCCHCRAVVCCSPALSPCPPASVYRPSSGFRGVAEWRRRGGAVWRPCGGWGGASAASSCGVLLPDTLKPMLSGNTRALYGTVVDTPIGPLSVHASERGVCTIDFGTIYRGARSHPIVDAATTQIREYFAGERQVFSVPIDDAAWNDGGFAARALHALRGIGYGQTCSYGALAGLAGSAAASRAAGTACAMNPVPLLIPCHRVIRSDGSLGNYRGGVGAKRLLLELEQTYRSYR